MTRREGVSAVDVISYCAKTLLAFLLSAAILFYLTVNGGTHVANALFYSSVWLILGVSLILYRVGNIKKLGL